MTTLAIATNASNPDTEDRRAMLFVIGVENVRRAAAGQSALPTSTAAERKSSYEACLNAVLAAAHASYIQQANEAANNDPQFRDLRPLWMDASSAQKTAARTALGG